MKKRIVIALGGNALGNNLAEQMTAARITAKAIVDLVEAGHEIAVVHGNGPQVGMIYSAFDTAASEHRQQFNALPLSVCVALSQGYIGYDLQNTIRTELDTRGIKKDVATIITQVAVDPGDKAFERYTKPIGNFMTKEQADELAAHGVPVMEDAGRGWRKAVASPRPLDIVEAPVIESMLAAGHIPIAAGGGGIPVSMRDGQYRGMSAVIDKDFAAAKLAQLIGADMLFILTAVEKVAINFGKPGEKWLDTVTVSEAEKYIGEKHFAEGSMLPKVMAAIEFLKSPGEPAQKSAVISLLSKARDALEGLTGTRIVR